MKYIFLLFLISCSPMTLREKRKEEFKDCVSRFFGEGMSAVEANLICKSVNEKNKPGVVNEH